MDVSGIARDIVRREGGFVDDPDDPGGATKHGVTVGTLRRLGLDLTGDGRVGVADVRAMTPERAAAIFVREYHDRPGIALLPEALRPSVFDFYVNAGSAAVRVLQELLTEMGEPLVVDGIIGPLTAGAAHRALARAPAHLADAYGIARREWYYALARRRPRLRKFARRRDGGKGGWILRAEEFVAERFRLTSAEHRERVAGWG
ncbi:holin-associated N-acetylmuramidase [Hasllibacter halocynthiae]|nr:holin-associated N-acetylmuramidase [Hasllibacter halocynthiae]